jgi:hypothetical protein
MRRMKARFCQKRDILKQCNRKETKKGVIEEE